MEDIEEHISEDDIEDSENDEIEVERYEDDGDPDNEEENLEIDL
jgi:hypothetical protein